MLHPQARALLDLIASRGLPAMQDLPPGMALPSGNWEPSGQTQSVKTSLLKQPCQPWPPQPWSQDDAG